MNFPALEKLIATAQNPAARGEELDLAAQDYFQALAKLSKREGEAAMGVLAEHFDLPDPQRGALLALFCGAMVERGYDPLPMARPFRLRMLPLLEDCARLADACCQELPESTKAKQSREDRDEFGDEEEDGPEIVSDNAEFEAIRARVARQLPREAAAWEALDTFWRPAIALYSFSPEARWASQALRAPAERIAEFHEAGHWIQLILSVLDNEPLLVIEPESRQGILARSFGVVDNFQLNTLLMDAFPTPDRRAMRRVPLHVAEIARGSGPQSSEDIVTGEWNLYTWQALQPNLQLPPATDTTASRHWIWNEGIPADIPLLGDRRVILLGPASYERSWRAQRMFDSLPANLHVEQTLSSDEVTAWLRKIVGSM